MTAIGLTLLIYLVCLILAGAMYWSCRIGNVAGFSNAKRTVLAMHRAAAAGLIKSTRSALLPLIAAMGLWVLVRTLFADARPMQRSVIAAAYVVFASLAGGLSAVVLSFLVLQWARITALRTIAASLTSADRLLAIVFRSSASLAMLIETIGYLVSLGVAGLFWAIRSENGPGGQLFLGATHVLSDFAMGALLVSFAIQASGTTYRICGRAGSAVAARDGNLGDQDPRNPSTIADAAGTQLGQLVPGALDAFCTSLCSNVVLLFLLHALASNNSPELPASYLLLPLVLRAFGALATVFATASLRTLESLNPASALLRSQAVFVVIVLGAVGGACTWLVPDQLASLAVCGGAGFLLPLAVSHWQNFFVSRAVQHVKSPRAQLDAYWTEGLSVGMLAVAAPVLLLVGVLIGVVKLGFSTGLAHGHWLALMVCYLGMGIAVPFCVTVDAAGPLVSLSRRAVHLIDSLRVDDGQRRLARLEEAAYSTSAHATSSQTQTSSGLPILAALAIGMLARTPSSNSAGAEALSTLYFCPMTLVIPLAIIMQASLRASRALSNEVRRQISGFPLEAGVFRIPADFTPSYRNCVDVASRESTKNLGFPSIAFVVLPLVYGAIVCRALHDTGSVGQTLALYLGVIAVTVVVVGFVLEAASDFANQTCARTPRATNLQHPLAVSDAVQHLAMHATPAVRLLAKATVIVALTYTPYVL